MKQVIITSTAASALVVQGMPWDEISRLDDERAEIRVTDKIYNLLLDLTGGDMDIKSVSGVIIHLAWRAV